MVPHSLLALVYTLVPTLQPVFPNAPFNPRHLSDGEFAKFSDPLPIPPRILAKTDQNGRPVELIIKLRQFNGKIHSALPTQPLWGYGGYVPGPTIDVERDQLVCIHWKSELPTKHIFPAPNQDLAIKLGLCLATTPDVRTVTHLHGAEVTSTNPNDRLHNNDGWPDAWILPGMEQITDYPNHQDARTLWYHDHAMGTTGRNVTAGLAGTYLIHDNYERSLNLPSGKYEIPLLFTALALNDDGYINYTGSQNSEYYGNSVAVNGKLWPYLDVEPRKYRFRMVNGSNARSYAMKLIEANDQNQSGPPLYQIGSDSGFLEKTIVLNDPKDVQSPRLLLAPGERADVIIDFSKHAGHELLLHNTSRDPGDGEIAMPEMMVFRVNQKLKQADRSRLPMKMKPIARIAPASASEERRIILAQSQTPDGENVLTLNGKSWNAPIDERPKLGATEIWNLTNTLPDVHPFHMHLVQFQVLDRTPFDTATYLSTGKINLTGPSSPPDANEMGWKDTVRVTGSSITRIIMKFLPYPGYYLYHCHILEHEDMDMMRPFQIMGQKR